MGREHDRDLNGEGRPGGSDPPGAFGRTAVAAARRAGVVVSAALAAIVCAALLVNYVVMPLVARRGDHVPAPELVGLSLFEARRAADEAGFRIRVDAERPDPQYRAGDVIMQTPAGGLDVKLGRTLVLVVSAGIDRRTVPALTGLTARQAQIEAELAGFAVSEIIQVHADAVERGRVIGTDPGDGAVAPAGGAIRMLVSLGPRAAELVMPSLVGRTPEEARLVAEELGLTVRSIKYERSRGFLRDVVVVQDPVAGSRVVAGEGVTLRVGKG
jgi:serine/threonine-protein kinase